MLASACSLAACSSEKGGLPFTSGGSTTGYLQLSSGNVAFWVDIDIQYEGSPVAQYRIELEQAGQVVATAVCDPLDHMSIKVGWIEKRLGASHSKSGTGKMNCSAHLATGGTTTVRTTLNFRTVPTALTLTKATLVVKQGVDVRV